MDGRAPKPRRLSRRNDDHYQYDSYDYDNDFEYTKLKGVASLGALATMSSWIQRQASSHQVQLGATAVLSAAAVAGAIFGVQAIRRKVAVEELKASIPRIDEDHRLQKVRLPFKNLELCLKGRELTGGSEAHGIWYCISGSTSQ